MSVALQDVFISYASADKKKYIDKLTAALSHAGVTFWIDNIEIKWGDSVILKINEGLANSKLGLVCFSNAFLKRPWPEAEMSAVLGLQNASCAKRMIPLILNSKDAVLAQYPLLNGLAYREFSMGPRKVAAEIASLVGMDAKSSDRLVTPHKLAGEIASMVGTDAEFTGSLVTIEGFHTGLLCKVSNHQLSWWYGGEPLEAV